ncbi:MAG: helix-turn-helix domain-containing protein, partial [Bacteroidota bacterium]
MEAAIKLLVENGLHATPMSALAKAANTGMSTIYNYFSTKEILINTIYVVIKHKEEALLSTSVSMRPVKTQFEHYYALGIEFYL